MPENNQRRGSSRAITTVKPEETTTQKKEKKKKDTSMGDSDRRRLEFLIATQKANPTNAGIFQTALGEIGETLFPREDTGLEDQIVNMLAQGEAAKFSEGDPSALGNIRTLLGEGIEGLEGFGEQERVDIGAIPEEFQQGALEDRFARALANARQTGNFDEVTRLRDQFGKDFKFDVDEEGNVSVTRVTGGQRGLVRRAEETGLQVPKGVLDVGTNISNIQEIFSREKPFQELGKVIFGQ